MLNLQLFAKVSEEKEIIEVTPASTPEEVEAIAEVTPEPTQAEIEAYLDERIPVTIFGDNEKYKEPVVVSVNGEMIFIKRNVQVYIKRRHQLVLENQLRQRNLTLSLVSEAEKVPKLD